MILFKRRRESEIDSVETWKDDAFDTLESYATFLTNALVADGGNFVLNVNGAWGTGKTFFVNRWAEHLRQAGHPVVEFNAWENDNEADPLTSLLAECLSALEPLLPKRSALVKNLKQKGGRIALSLGNIVTQAVLRKAVGDDGAKELKDLFSKETEQEFIQLGGSLIQEQMKKKLERKAFTDELKVLVLKLQEEQNAPIFIFIDELDRCRPIFAIELLERVKHLFGVDGIKFIITTDSQQLAHSICGAYGAGFDGATYLRRFFDETFTLPEPDAEQFAERLWSASLSIGRAKDEWIYETTPTVTFSNLSSAFGLTLRDQVQAAHRIEAVINNIQYSSGSKLHFIYLCALVMLRMQKSEDYHSLTHEPRVGTGVPSQAFKQWHEVGDQMVILGVYNEILKDYFVLARGNHDAAIKLCNSAQARVEDPRSRSDISWLKHDLYRSVVMDFKTFKLYPQLVELTAQLS
jgi:hypothetical protein